MKLLALDPSSTAVGYCFGVNGKVEDAGVLWPAKKSAPAMERIVSLADQLGEMITGSCCSRAVLEIPSKHVNTRRHGGKGGGLATYGVAVGFYWAHLRHLGIARDHIDLIEPETWVRGRSKLDRQLVVAGCCPDYDPALDPGGDCSDAICLMWWWFERNLVTQPAGDPS